MINEESYVYYNKTTKKIKNNLRFMKEKHNSLYKEIDNYLDDTITLDSNKSKEFTIKFYCYVHQIQLKKCSHHNCSNEVIYKKGKFNDFCSIQCCNTSNAKQTKIKTTWKNKSDEEHQSKIDKFKKSYQKNYPKFKDNIMKSKSITNLEYWDNKEFIQEKFLDSNNHFKLYEFMDFFNCCQPKAHTKLKELDIIFTKTNKMYSQSEKDVLKYVQELLLDQDYTISENIRIENKEFDILVKKDDIYILGIEFDGIYWHSYSKDKTRPKSYYKNKHIIKTQIADDNNFQLFHIFEDEWKDPIKQDIWKSVIRSKFKLSELKIGARQCDIKIVNSVDATLFNKTNHLQGTNNKGSIRIGLYYNNKLVQLGTFGKSQFKKNINNETFELIRMCSQLNTSVAGGASRILKYFENRYKPKCLISYANKRWSQGDVYSKLSFTKETDSPPNHYYIKNNKLVHRMKYQTHKVREILQDKYIDSLSGIDNAIQLLNVGVIWDSGNYVYVKHY